MCVHHRKGIDSCPGIDKLYIGPTHFNYMLKCYFIVIDMHVINERNIMLGGAYKSAIFFMRNEIETLFI